MLLGLLLAVVLLKASACVLLACFWVLVLWSLWLLCFWWLSFVLLGLLSAVVLLRDSACVVLACFWFLVFVACGFCALGAFGCRLLACFGAFGCWGFVVLWFWGGFSPAGRQMGISGVIEIWLIH